jgi:endonuclease/exonuclease/phosphatase family metal-dependent hydrolase
MWLDILTLNCQKGYTEGISGFMEEVISEGRYDFILLQESAFMTDPDNKSGYGILRKDTGDTHHELSIMYKNIHAPEEVIFSDFRSFDASDANEYGVLAASFGVDDKKVIISTTHLHSGLRKKIRAKEMVFVKERIDDLGFGDMVVMGGDFNSGFPGEWKIRDGIMSPEYMSCGAGTGHTCDSRRSEHNIDLGRLNRVLGKMGISFRFRVDDLYVDSKTASEREVCCRKLDVEVSDHYPLELSIT